MKDQRAAGTGSCYVANGDDGVQSDSRQLDQSVETGRYAAGQSVARH
jgi:hypothetical protein